LRPKCSKTPTSTFNFKKKFRGYTPVKRGRRGRGQGRGAPNSHSWLSHCKTAFRPLSRQSSTCSYCVFTGRPTVVTAWVSSLREYLSVKKSANYVVPDVKRRRTSSCVQLSVIIQSQTTKQSRVSAFKMPRPKACLGSHHHAHRLSS